MLSFIYTVDKFSAWVGKAFAWMILVIVFGVAYEVFMRYVFRAPTSWHEGLGISMYGALFMMAGAYTLSRDQHVRADIFYRTWSPKAQARLELTLYILFFFPGMLGLVFAGWSEASNAIRWGQLYENSPSAANFPIYQLKALIPAAGVIMTIQGLAQLCRCIVCLRTGAWPPLLHDVEEMESVLQHAKEDHLGETTDAVKGAR